MSDIHTSHMHAITWQQALKICKILSLIALILRILPINRLSPIIYGQLTGDEFFAGAQH